MTRFNLLPAELINKRKRRRLLIALAVTQTFIAAAVAASFPAVNYIDRYISSRSRELTRLIASPVYNESDAAAESLAALKDSAAAADYTINSLQPAVMNAGWLDGINGTLPPDVELTGFKMDAGRLTVNCLTTDLAFAEEHRRLLADSGFSVTLGGVTVDGGLYGYTLYAG